MLYDSNGFKPYIYVFSNHVHVPHIYIFYWHMPKSVEYQFFAQLLKFLDMSGSQVLAYM
jgi:hypothetical protein